MYNVDEAVILNDHQLFSDLFALFLRKEGLFDCVTCYRDIPSFLDFISKRGNKAICIFLDYHLPDSNGISVIQEVRRFNSRVRVVYITSTGSPKVLQQIYLSRPHAILSQYCDIPTLRESLQLIRSEQIYLDEYTQRALQEADSSNLLTPREIEILRYFQEGYTVTQTAEKLYLSKHTVVAHRRNMMAKTNTRSINQLLKFAHDNKLV